MTADLLVAGLAHQICNVYYILETFSKPIFAPAMMQIRKALTPR